MGHEDDWHPGCSSPELAALEERTPKDRPWRERLADGESHRLGEVSGGEPGSRAFRLEIAGHKDVLTRDTDPEDDGLGELPPGGFFAWQAPFDAIAEGNLNFSDSLHQPLEVVGFQGGPMVGAFGRPVQGEVAFHEAGP